MEDTISELEFKRIKTNIISSIANVEANSIHEEIIKGTILMLIDKVMKDEETLNDNLEILNKSHYEEISMARFRK